LESIVHYATDTSDASVEKVAFGVLNKMVMVWSSPSNGPSTNGELLDKGFQELFGTFVIEHLSRFCFEVPSKSTFNSNDAQSRLVLIEIGALQKAIYNMKGEKLCSYLRSILFPKMGVPSTAAEEYIRAIQQLDLKQFKKYFVVFFPLR
jgi:exportin-T